MDCLRVCVWRGGGGGGGGGTGVAFVRHAIDELCLLLDAAPESSTCNDGNAAGGLHNREAQRDRKSTKQPKRRGALARTCFFTVRASKTRSSSLKSYL